MKVRQLALKATFVFVSTTIVMLALLWVMKMVRIELGFTLYTLIGGFVGMIAAACYAAVFEIPKNNFIPPDDVIG